MAYFGKSMPYQITKQPLVYMGDGENVFVNPFEIKTSESSYSRNTSSRNYPALSVRRGRSKMYGTDTTVIAAPNGLSQRNDQYPHIHDGTTWKRWDGTVWQTVASSLANAMSKFLEFNTAAKRYTIFMDGTNKKAWDGSSVTTLTDAPATRLYAIDDYRLYALKDNVLSYSAAGSPSDWTTAGDAGSSPITSIIGAGTAIAAFNDQIICWSAQSMHILYGDDYENFEWNKNPISCGCISDRSVVIDNGILYFLDYGRFYAYTGGMPEEIGQKVRTYLEAIPEAYKHLCVSASQGRYIYLSIPYGAVTANNLTLEYDTSRGTWYVHNYGIKAFTNIGEGLYGIDNSGVIWKLNDGTITTDAGTAITWEHITGAWFEGTLRSQKVISEIWMVVDLPVGSTLTVSYSDDVDGTSFTTLYTATASADEQNLRIQVPTDELTNIDWYRLKFSGSGPCTVHYVEIHMRVKDR